MINFYLQKFLSFINTLFNLPSSVIVVILVGVSCGNGGCNDVGGGYGGSDD